MARQAERPAPGAGMRVQLAGSRDAPDPPADEVPLLEALAERGAPPEWIVWEKGPPEVGALVVPRATWTYHRRERAYRAWLAEGGRRGCRFVNPLRVLRWNLDKGYLLELEAAGVNVVPTLRFEAGAAPPLARVLDGALPAPHGIVLKPAVSASGDDTWRADAATAEAESRWREATARRPHLVQPFVPEILREGEWSAVVIRGSITHAVLKRPAAGEFRTQHERGGTKERVDLRDVPREVLEGARAAWRAIPGRPVYARMDGVRAGGRFRLMEAELIDPELYLTMSGGAARALAGAVLAMPAGSASADGSASAERAAES